MKTKVVQLDLFGNPIEEPKPPSTEIMPLDFESHAVRVVMIKGEPWWVAADVCRVLGLEAGARHVRERLDANDIRTVSEACGTADVISGLRFDALLVNEPGLYVLIFESRKPEAKRFKRWITHEVLPQIRKTGTYKGRTDSRLARTMRRMKADEATAEVRLKNTDINKAIHALLSESGAGRSAYPAFHNAVYRGQFGRDCGEIKKALGMKSGTPLDRMSMVVLTENNHIKALAATKAKGLGEPLTADEAVELIEGIARGVVASDLEMLGEGYQLGIEVRPARVASPGSVPPPPRYLAVEAGAFTVQHTGA